MLYDDEYKRNVVNRWKTIEGHVAAVRRWLEADTYCPDILRQAIAIQGAIDSANAMVLENHLHTCASEALRGEDPDARERVIRELLDLFASGSNVTWSRQLPGLAETEIAEPAR